MILLIGLKLRRERRDSLQIVALHHLAVCESRLVLIAGARFKDLQVIDQILDLFTNLDELFTFLANRFAQLSLSIVLLINILPMANSANHNNAFLDVEQDAIVTHAQAVRDFRLAQPLNVSMEDRAAAFGSS